LRYEPEHRAITAQSDEEIGGFSRRQSILLRLVNADANVGDRNDVVLATPNMIMNDIRLRGLAVAGSEAAGRKNPDNHAQTVRNRDAPSRMRPLVPG